MLFRLPSEEELTDNKLNEFIAKHDAECAFRFKRLKDAYETDYQIFHQKPKPNYKPDNRIAVNFAKYTVDTFNGFFIGNPIKISVDDDATDNIKKYVEFLDQYNDQDDNNAELSKICCIYGKGYEMYYVDELGNIGITYLTPFDAFMIYDDSVLCRERYFVRLYIDSNDVLHGSVSDAEKVRWFTQKGKLIWEEEEKIHGFDGVPATEYVENKERTCIFEPAMSMIDAYNKAIELQKEKGYTFIHPFNDPDVIAGQGTIGLEILEQLPDVDAVVVPIGGGGLIAGVAYTIKQINPNCKVYGIQAAGAASMQKSIGDGKIETLESVQTIADGIAVKTPGTNTYELVSKYVDGIYTVSDDEIALAILTLMEQQKLVSEGAGAVPVAAVMNGKIPDIEGKKVCCVVSGGNIDVTILSRVIERGLKMGGRSAYITIALSDKPGQLLGVSKVVAENGANVVSVNYDSTDLDMNITDCYLKIGIETRNYQHIVQIKNALKEAGFEVCD